MLDEAWNKFVQSVADSIVAIVDTQTAKIIEREFKRNANELILSETQAAEYLKVSRDTLAAWRKRRLIDYAQYPKGRLADGAEDGLSDMYSYSVQDLDEFRERYLHRTPEARRRYLKVA